MGDRGEVRGHMLYADDTIIICDPATEKISFLIVILVLFEAVSAIWSESELGKKSSLFPVNEVPQIRQLAGIPGGVLGSFLPPI